MPDLLTRVPARTPFLLASLAPARGYLQAELAPRLARYRRIAEHLRRVRSNSSGAEIEGGALIDLYLAVADELGPDFELASLSRVGLSPDAHFAVYGVGLMPVVRLEVADPQRLRAAITRVLARSGTPRQIRIARGVEVIIADLWSRQLLIAFDGDELVVSTTPAPTGAAEGVPSRDPDRIAAALDQLLARDLGDTSLARSTDFAEMLQRHQLPADMVAFVDLEVLLQLAMDEVSTAGANPMTPECADEVSTLVGLAPRLAAGNRFGSDGFTARLVLELRGDIANELLGVRAPVPGIRPQDSAGARLAVATGVDLGRVARWLDRRLGAVTERPFRCAGLSWLNELVISARAYISAPTSLQLRSLHGVSIILSDLELGGRLPTKLSGLMFVGTSAPDDLMSLIAAPLRLSPGQVVRGASPVRLDVPPATSLLGPVHIASSDWAVGLSIGEAEVELLSELLARDPMAKPPFLFARFDPSLYELVATDELAPPLAAAAALDNDLYEELSKLERTRYSHYREVTIAVEPTRHGLVADIHARSR